MSYPWTINHSLALDRLISESRHKQIIIPGGVVLWPIINYTLGPGSGSGTDRVGVFMLAVTVASLLPAVSGSYDACQRLATSVTEMV
jgi:hypothetical protein